MSRIAARPALKTPTAKRWVTLLALLAFFVQSLAVQTHIHPTSQPASVKLTAAHTPSSAPLHSQAPIDQCRLCQELVHAGVFVAPSASFVIASPLLTATIFAVLPSVFVSLATAFDWQSRAPPRR